MQTDTYELLLRVIKEKVPQKTKLANLLTDLLLIEKEAVYRRLRGDVPFTFTEIVKISRALNISLDSLVGVNTPQSYPFQLKLTRYYNLTEIDYNMHKEYIELISNMPDNMHSEMGFASGILPLHFTLKQETIQRFYTLRWQYQFGDPGSVPPLSEIVFSDELKFLFQKYLNDVENFKYTCFIWDKRFVTDLINDIKYFNSIRLITDEEVQILKNEILEFLIQLEQLCIHGAFRNNNRVDVYISSLNFESTYTYMQTEQYKITMLKAYTLSEVVSLNEEVFDKTKKWFQSLKRTSVLISGSDERSRIIFFEKQRRILEEGL